MLELINKAEKYVFNIYLEQNDDNLLYYNFSRVKNFITVLNDNIDAVKTGVKDTTQLEFALLFSETGYFVNFDKPTEHSIGFFNEFCTQHNLENDYKNVIINCLKTLSAKIPTTYLEKSFNDIYYSSYGSSNYKKEARLLRKDIENNKGYKISNKEWVQYVINLLSNHKYYTEFGVLQWQATKHETLTSLIKSENKFNKTRNKEKLKAKYKTKYKDASPERSIQTLYRTALRNHIKLSDIADTKANILLSVNAIIISLVLSNLLSKLDNPSNRYMIFPSIIFVVFSIISMIMSIKATQPNVTRGEFTEEDLKNKNVNLAFFGNFHKVELKKYQAAINELIQNKNDVYNTLTKDLYFLGSVLDSKYKLLRYTYFIFMAGIVVSVTAFAIAFYLRDTITM